MGCDIHMMCEQKDKYEPSQEWICKDHFELICNKEEGVTGHALVPLYDHRHYEMFAALANVRNRGGTPCIDEPRGLPNDLSILVEKHFDDYKEWCHSFSHVSLREVMEYCDTYNQITRSGYVSPETFLDYEQCGVEPTMWCRGTTDETWRYLEWTVDYNPLNELKELMMKRAFPWSFMKPEDRTHEAYDHFRIVFCFDS